jgi:large repetitive protein
MVRTRFVLAWCLITALVLPAAAAIGVTTAQASTPKVTVALSSSVAGVNSVTYTLGFTATSAIPASGNITLVGPPDTIWPNSNSAYVLTDSTTSSGSFSGASSNSSSDPGTDIYNWLNGPRGAAITIGVPNAINAGDHLSLAISGVVNPAAGTDTLSVLTSADSTASKSASYTITAPGKVSKSTVSLSSSAPGANDVTYTIGFITSSTGAVPAGGSITLLAPSGTIWPDLRTTNAYVLTDSTTSSGSFTNASSTSFGDPGTNIYNWIDGNRGAAVTIVIPNAINAGDHLSLVVSNVVNPAAGSDTLAVSTSSDTEPSTSASYTVSSAAQVSQPSVSLSSYAAGATGVTYTVGFKPNSDGAIAAGGGITLVAPAGTVLPSGTCSYVLSDSTTSSGSFSCASHVSLNSANVASITVPNAIDASDVLSLAIAGVTNPGAGPDTLSVATSTNVTATTSSTYTVTGAASSLTSVVSPTFSASSHAAGADAVNYVFNFTTSASGALTGGSSAVDVVAPGGTIFGVCPYGDCGPSSTYTFTDHTNSAGSGVTVGDVSGINNILSVPVPNTIAAGDSVTLTITAVTNAIAGDANLYLSTSADQEPVALADNATAAKSLKSVTMTASSPAEGATGVNYTINFTASSSGALEPGDTGVVNIQSPDGTIFGGCPYGDCGPSSTYTFTDHTTQSGSGPAGYTSGADGLTSIGLPQAIQAGDSVTLVITAVTNPLAAGNFLISTSSDTVPVSVNLAAKTPSAVSNAALSMSSTVAGSTSTTWTINYTTSATGELVGLDSTINLFASEGTSFGSAEAKVVDATTPSGSASQYGDDVIGNGSVASFDPFNSIEPGDHIQLVVSDVTNSSTSGPGILYLSTSSDTTPVAVKFSLSSGAPVSGEVTYNSNPVASAPVQVCPTAGGSCSTATTGSDGTFSVEVPYGKYSATGYPNTSTNAAPGTVGGLDVSSPSGVSGADIALTAPPSLPAGVTLTSSDFGEETSSTSNPTVNWEQPFDLDFSPSLFPTSNTLITQVDIEGTSTVTGQPTMVAVAPGGTVDGSASGGSDPHADNSGNSGSSDQCDANDPTQVPIPATPGTQIQIPALAPIHGPITTFVHYLSYSAGVVPPAGVGFTPYLCFLPGDNELLTVTNNEIPAGVEVNVASITGPNAADFSIVTPKTEDTGYPDCADAQLLEANADTGPGTATCTSQIQWTPNGTDPFEYADAVVDVGNYAPALVQLVGCNPALTNECGSGNFDMGGPGPDSNVSFGGGGGGAAGSVSGGDDDGGQDYVDPSGVVETTTSQGTAPIAGATVTLEQGPNTNGPFTAVPNGSDVMSPANRTNPDTTAADGSFGWDTLAGTYDVTASANGCTSGQLSQPVTVPPPATNLDISLSCSSAPTRTSTTTSLTTSANPVDLGAPLTLTADVTGSSPTGTVTFLDGSTSIGTAPLNTSGVATLTTSTLPAGSDGLNATYNGDGSNQPSTTDTVNEGVTAPTAPAKPEILTTSLERAVLARNYASWIAVNGGTSPYQFSVASGSLPKGLKLNATTGEISGKAKVLGKSSFSVEVRDANSNSTTSNLSITVVTPAVLKLKPKTLASATTGSAYSQRIKAKGGTAPYTLTVTSGTLPSGLTLSGSGVLSGTPTTTGTYDFTVGATDSLGNTGSIYYSLSVT